MSPELLIIATINSHPGPGAEADNDDDLNIQPRSRGTTSLLSFYPRNRADTKQQLAPSELNDEPEKPTVDPSARYSLPREAQITTVCCFEGTVYAESQLGSNLCGWGEVLVEERGEREGE